MRRRRALTITRSARAPPLPQPATYMLELSSAVLVPCKRTTCDTMATITSFFKRSGVTGKSDSVKRPREGHSELPHEDDSAKRSREGDSELPCESDSELPHREGDSELPRESDSDSELPCESDSELPRREGDSELPRESDSELPRRELEGDSESDREASGSSKVKKRHRVDKHSTSFDPGWVRRWDWLRPVYGSSHTVVGLLCHLCQKHKTTARNGSTKWSREPCMCMRVDSVQRHAKSHQHAGSVAKEHASLPSGDIGCIFSSAARKQISSNREAVVGALRSLYFLVKHSIPHTTLFGPFLDFCILQGCEYLSNLHLAGNAHYRSERVIQEFLVELGTQVFRSMLSQLQDSPYIALMADETTDIAITKELILYARYIVPSAIPQHSVRSIFLQVSELSDGKADTITTAILELLTSLDLSINKVMGFGSDGASVMVGRRAGVATLLKGKNPQIVAIHCVAHRLALAVAQAGDAVPYIKRFKVLLHNLFSFYDNSPVRTAGLRSIQKNP